MALVTSATVSQIDLAGHANSRRVARKVLNCKNPIIGHISFDIAHLSFADLRRPEAAGVLNGK